ncbi:MAG TPA: serine hydrolase [Methylomirabilota bacterium]|nr:serine hydrolase [Methylomirabilota bacterium]
MKTTAALLFGLLLPLAPAFAAEPVAFANRDERLQTLVNDVVKATLTEFAARNLQSNQLAVTLVDLRDAKPPKFASYRGGTPIYPASVVKLLYLAAAHRWMEDAKLKDTPELRRALRDMIVDSSNDATHYVLDALTDTTSGPELPETEMKSWGEKRNAVNRYFASLGYTNINANQKPWNDAPYGRERIWVGKDYGNRNALTTEATARLLTEMVLGQSISSERSAQMMKLLARDPFGKTSDRDDQSHGFTGPAVPAGGKLFSKAGWTSTTRHDAAYVELVNGQRFVLVTFTTSHAHNREIIPFVATQVIARFGQSR